VAQIWYDKNRDIKDLQRRVSEFFNQFSTSLPTDFHRDLAALPFKLCIVTTPDDFLYNAFKVNKVKKEPLQRFYNLRKQREENFPVILSDLSPRKPIVYHLYGHHKDPSSLVITEDDLITLLVNLVQNEPRLPDIVRTYLKLQETTYLFIDCGFKNWYLRVLLKALSLYDNRRDKSFALEEDAEFFAQSERHQTVIYFSNDRRIEFKEGTLPKFARKLREVYETLPSPEEEQVLEVSKDAPKAFLCYANEDRLIVGQLARRLQLKGIAVWQDVQKLRAGDNWDRALVQVIDKQVNYVVVVQTPAMVGRMDGGIFYKEIRAALKRKETMPENRRFIIPISVGVNKPLDILEDLHTVSVDPEGEIGNLADAILEDWQSHR
jgi:hypothetical protein